MFTVDRGGIAAVTASDEARLLAIARLADTKLEDDPYVNHVESFQPRPIPCPPGCTCRGTWHTEPFGI